MRRRGRKERRKKKMKSEPSLRLPWECLLAPFFLSYFFASSYSLCCCRRRLGRSLILRAFSSRRETLISFPSPHPATPQQEPQKLSEEEEKRREKLGLIWARWWPRSTAMVAAAAGWWWWHCIDFPFLPGCYETITCPDKKKERQNENEGEWASK